MVVTSIIVLFAPEVLAQETELTQVGESAGLGETNIRVFIAKIIRYAIMLVGVVFFAIVVYGGVLWMTAHGDPEQLRKAKAVLKNGVIGLFIVLASYSIASFIINALLRGDGVWGPQDTPPGAGIEPLSGSLGSGIIEDHWPQRNAIDIARNTTIIITFKEPIAIESLTDGAPIENGDGDEETLTDNVWNLNLENVLIYRNEDADGVDAGDLDQIALQADEVQVMTTQGQTIWVFDPVEYLGSALEETDYTVALQSGIIRDDGFDAFVGNYSEGYEWSFEVSTEIDITPPHVNSVLPGHGNEMDRNIVVQINFNEAIDPTSASGVFNEGFENILVNYSTIDEVILDEFVDGTWTISNGYQTVEFVTFDACGEDPCGDTIYCLPASSYVTTTAYAATLGDEPPEAAGFPYDGVVDVCGNSLDSGRGNFNDEINGIVSNDTDGVADGPDADNFAWRFATTADVNVTSPSIESIAPDEYEQEVALDAPIEFMFTGTDYVGPNGDAGVTIMSSTLSSSNISLIPFQDPDLTHELWYRIEKQDLYAGYAEEPLQDGDAVTATVGIIDHGLFLESDEDANEIWFYYPWITEDVKSSYQICFYPAYGPPVSNYCGVDDEGSPSCCYLNPDVECSIP